MTVVRIKGTHTYKTFRTLPVHSTLKLISVCNNKSILLNVSNTHSCNTGNSKDSSFQRTYVDNLKREIYK